MDEELRKRLLKFISVKIYVFTLVSLLAVVKIPIDYFDKIVALALAFFAVRAFQYWQNGKDKKV